MAGIAAILAAIASGIATVFSYGNIAISVSIVCLALSLSLNYIFIRKLFVMLEVLNGVKDAVSALNDRIKHD
jgi:hypothetical protein